MLPRLHKIGRSAGIFCLASALALTAGCGTTKKAGADKKVAKSKTIAFLMPCATCAARFESKDKPFFIKAVHDLDPSVKVIANNAQGSGPTQLRQAEAALTNGAGVIVMSPMTAEAGAATVAKAKAQGASVVSYDGLIAGGARPDAYVTFDNEKVGELQGQYLADHLKAGAAVAMINGAPDSTPGQEFKKGAHKILDPLFASGKLRKAYEGDAKNFDPAVGQRLMEQALTKLHDKVDGVLVANDGLANSVITALTARHLNGKVLVTGQDATDPGLQQILTGNQSMTVYKSINDEAVAAAKIAVDLLNGKKSAVAGVAKSTTNNGTADIPSLLLDPVSVDRKNMAATVFADGFTTKEKVCAGAAAASCP